MKSGPFTQKSSGSSQAHPLSSSSSSSSPWSTGSNNNNNGSWEFVTERDSNNHGLSEEQCRIAFPKLFIEIDKSASLRGERPITFKEVDEVRVDEGMVRGVIDHGEVMNSFFHSLLLAWPILIFCFCSYSYTLSITKQIQQHTLEQKPR